MSTSNTAVSTAEQAKNPWLNASVTLAVLAVVCAATFGSGRHYAEVHWGGGNFPPLVGHVAVALMGSVMLAGMGASLLGAGLAVWCAKRALGSERRHLGIALAACLVNLAAFIYMKM